ncbi:MAG TPA: type IV toxin-antitoxin system AbiEi family antitoxin domain-containing protein [Solirubrobacterales bacterium]|nr:type IV toxin-antitoxin system AbiEi family antitoxin domain-containing protein [Solirubrobacterales bacterium]
MSEGRNYKRSRRAWELAERQHGLVARRQLLALGFNPREIEHRVARGRLHVVMRGVYAVGWPHMTRKRWWMASVLACGERALLSHRSAAALWEIGSERREVIDVSVMRRAELKRRGLRVRGRPSLRAECVTSHDDIPITTPVQTLIDLSTELAPIGVERAINEADKRDLIDPETLRAELDGRIGEPGVKALRTILDKRTFRLSDSDLEVLFRPIAMEAGLPPPLTKEVVNGFEVDFFFPDLGLVIETDGLRYHRTASTQARDARRDRAHTLAGMTPLRFTHYEIKHESARVRSELRRIATRLTRPSDIDPLQVGSISEGRV